ncbi:hypothetical protein BDP27DRAFT_1362916 [Rhodocollybia butyracea]|uniref:Protein kinase domain-containing protein n=1 Tax=Rhodocollybia butyracea TaxID=206335 RepID=A0A9P5U9G2_9AGAR|nr:hypothetical protein BDP27DRAFT_1362916 [Rhodocollybia butyracea]
MPAKDIDIGGLAEHTGEMEWRYGKEMWEGGRRRGKTWWLEYLYLEALLHMLPDMEGWFRPSALETLESVGVDLQRAQTSWESSSTLAAVVVQRTGNIELGNRSKPEIYRTGGKTITLAVDFLPRGFSQSSMEQSSTNMDSLHLANSPNSPRTSSPLNPHPQQAPSHGHSASYSGPSASYRDALVSSPPSSPPILGPPFQPTPPKGHKGRDRGHSVSSAPTQTSMMLSPASASHGTLGDIGDGASSFRERSRSSSRSPISMVGITPPAMISTPSRSSWWRREEDRLSGHTRPWFDSDYMKPRRHSVATTTPTGKEGKNVEPVSHEQMQNWDTTRKRVAQAASSILGTSALIAHEVLLRSVDLVELAPVPGLSAAARTLLEIWESLQQVDSNRLQCLRLTERCADILLSVRQEVWEAGDQVAEELKLPVDKLTESFTDVHTLLIKQAGRPFLKRYLKRDEISKQISLCDIGLQEALGMFSAIQLAEARRQHDTEEILKNVVHLSHMGHFGGSETPVLQGQITAETTIVPSGSTSSITSTPPAKQSFPYAIPSISYISAGALHHGTHGTYGPDTSNNASNIRSGSLLFTQLGTPIPKGSAAASAQSLIPGLQGLPDSSSHSSLSQGLSQLQLQWNDGTNGGGVHVLPTVDSSAALAIVPSLSVTPSSQPSTASGPSTSSGARSPTSTTSTATAIPPSTQSTTTAVARKASVSLSASTSTVVPSAPATEPDDVDGGVVPGSSSAQNLLDAESDYADLRGVMRAALSKGSDVEMMRVLGVGLRRQSRQGRPGRQSRSGDGEEGAGILEGGLDAGEIAEAIKTLQRAHEAILEKERWEGQQGLPGLGLGLGQGQEVDVDRAVEGEVDADADAGNVGHVGHAGDVEGRPGFARRSSSFKALARIKRRMSLQSSNSYSYLNNMNSNSNSVPTTPLNETIIDEEDGESGSGSVMVGNSKKRKMTRNESGSSGGGLIRSKTVSSSSTSSAKTKASGSLSIHDSLVSQAGSGSGHTASGQSGTGSGKFSVSGGSGGSSGMKDTLDKEFIESGIDALRRMSRSTAGAVGSGGVKNGVKEDPATVLPSWTITRHLASPVCAFRSLKPVLLPSSPPAPTRSYSYSAPSRTVAIKVLAETTPRSLFLRETAIWKTLVHHNVLELYGASSASGDPPWFFVSPYLKHGSLAEFLRRGSTPDPVDGRVKIPKGLVLAGNNAYPAYGVFDTAGGRSRTASLPGYSGWNGGGLGSLVGHGAHGVHLSPATDPDMTAVGLGLGASAAHPYGLVSSNLGSPALRDTQTHSRGRSGSGSMIGGSVGSPAGFGIGAVGDLAKEWDLLRFMHEIAKGMEYLHSRGVLHGDLKAANVLVDDKIHCVISDFGQSEMRSEAYRISGTPPPHGTLRWQAPELMAGSSQLTVEMDVYAFAICCTEVLSLGRMPWPFYDDDQVRNQILTNQRPVVPGTCFTTPDLVNLISSCWATNPFYRPPFSKVASELKALRKVFAGMGPTTPGVGNADPVVDLDLRSPQLPQWHEYESQHNQPPSLPSPDMHPIPLSSTEPSLMSTPPRDIHRLSRDSHAFALLETPSSSYSNSSGDASYRTARDVSVSPHDAVVGGGHRESTVAVSLSNSTAGTITPTPAFAKFPSSDSPFAPAGVLPLSPTPSSAPFSPTSPAFSPSGSSPFFAYGSSMGYSGLGNNSNYGYGYGHDAAPSAGPGRLQMPETVIYTPSRPSSSPTSSIFTSTPSESQSDEGYAEGYEGKGRTSAGDRKAIEYDGYDSPPPENDLIAEARNERRYRLLLAHEFHPSLTLPLWSPAPVSLGAIGYLSKPKGEFVTLLNAFHPHKSANTLSKGLASVHGYGKLSTGSQRQDKRNAAQRGLDAIAGLLTFKGRSGSVSKSVSRRYSFPLRAGHKTAHLCTETTMYRYVENLDAPKKWFKANVDTILEVFGPQHHIQKEDLFFGLIRYNQVIGTLDTPEHALFVSHNHPDGQAHFNVFTSPKSRQPWGTFTTDTEMPSDLGGPSYHEPLSGSPRSASRISTQGNYPWNTVLIARLRFKPDVLEPTSL